MVAALGSATAYLQAILSSSFATPLPHGRGSAKHTRRDFGRRPLVARQLPFGKSCRVQVQTLHVGIGVVPFAPTPPGGFNTAVESIRPLVEKSSIQRRLARPVHMRTGLRAHRTAAEHNEKGEIVSL